MAHLPSPVTAEHIGYAVIRLAEIEETKPHGGVHGRRLVDLRLAQKRHIEELLEAYRAEVRRLEGRTGNEGSMTPAYVGVHGAVNKRNETRP